jgi:hypothetical protein
MKTLQPKDLTKITWNWRRNYGRLRIGWMSKYNWWLYGAHDWSWFFVFRNYPIRDYVFDNKKVGGYWQLTILGFQIGYCYRKDFKP